MNRPLASLLCLCLVLACWSCARNVPAGSTEAFEPLSAQSFTWRWTADLQLGKSGDIVRQVFISDEYVFVHTSTNRAFVLNRASGRILFVRTLAGMNADLYEPVVFKDYIVWPVTQRLLVFDHKGEQLQVVDLPFAIRSRAVGANNRVFVGADFSTGGRVAAIDISPRPYASRPVWELMTFGGLSAAPALFQGLLYAGSRDGNVYAVRAEDRAPIWPGLPRMVFRTDAEIVADLKADRDGVYVPSMDSKLYCLELTTGRQRWVYHSGQPLQQESSPVPTAHMVYLYVSGKGIVAIDKAAAANIRPQKWNVPEARRFIAEDAQYAYLHGRDGAILAVDRANGQVVFRSKRRDLVAFAENPKDGSIYAATANGQVYSIAAVLKPGGVGEVVALPAEGTPLARAR